MEADLVIYAGSLVNPELLKCCKDTCEIRNSAFMTLEQVIDAMVQAEEDGEKGRTSAYRRSITVRRNQRTDGSVG